MTNEQLRINIRPDSSVYGTFRRISYRPWSAIAEFLDNSTQNYFEHREDIGRLTKRRPALVIDIIHDPRSKMLTIVDDANGMNWEELERAIQLNRPPANTAGRSEFGMGLKMAACWFGSRWKIVTKRLGESIEYDAQVDVNRLEIDKPDAIVVKPRMGLDESEHYTRIEIEDLHRTFRGRALSSIRENIASMYRRDIDSGEITIRWNGTPFEWERDPVFEETAPDGTRTRWEKAIHFSVDGYSVDGKVWIRMPGEARRAGMHLFRRDRLVVGGPGEGYKPTEIFGAPNTFHSQRLVGELNLDKWPVTQTKDAFDWAGELENGFVDELRKAVSEYVQRLDEFRKTDPGTPTTAADGQVVGDDTKSAFKGSDVDSVLTIVETGPPPQAISREDVERVERAAEATGQPTVLHIGTESVPTLKVHWLDNLHQSEPHAQFNMPTDEELRLYMNLNHPFVQRVISRDPERLEVYAYLLYADALVERGVHKRGQNVPAHTFRDFKDMFLRVIDPNQE